MTTAPGPFKTIFLPDFPIDFHPMKGPMATQSLRGLANHGPMHWRGDRTGARDVPASAQPDTGLFDENAAFLAFNVTFPGLNGRHAPLPAADMQRFADFALQITYPPNPYRRLDNGRRSSRLLGNIAAGTVVTGADCRTAARAHSRCVELASANKYVRRPTSPHGPRGIR